MNTLGVGSLSEESMQAGLHTDHGSVLAMEDPWCFALFGFPVFNPNPEGELSSLQEISPFCPKFLLVGFKFLMAFPPASAPGLDPTGGACRSGAAAAGAIAFQAELHLGGTGRWRHARDGVGQSSAMDFFGLNVTH